MSNRDKFREWISGHYNVRHPFNDIIDWLAMSDEAGMGADISALLDEYGAAINDILARLRSREIIAV